MTTTLPILDFRLDILDEVTTKTKLAQCLGVSRQTLTIYHDLAALYIDGFIQNYPRVGDKAYTRAGMNKYQSWVLGKLIYEGMRLTYKVLEAKLEDPEYTE
ncbi:hypothetical protein, partial [Fischerella thermalis]|uniref:hypothetical protein n=1 Tax=Fischerella thermalis TaxID=372787 RepID=UPI000C80AB7A